MEALQPEIHIVTGGLVAADVSHVKLTKISEMVTGEKRFLSLHPVRYINREGS
jgi:hypothetical protein